LFFEVEKYATDSGFIFWGFPFWEWFLPGVGLEGGFGSGPTGSGLSGGWEHGGILAGGGGQRIALRAMAHSCDEAA
jgi:hypothetical protein